MLINFKLENFKKFNKALEFDFSKVSGYEFNKDCIYNNLLSKIILYGKNATGKTSLGKAIMDIKFTVQNSYVNVDNNFVNINNSFSKFDYTFKFDDDILIYKYKKSSYNTLLEEKLILNDKDIFYCNFEDNKYEFYDLKSLSVETLNTNNYKNAISSYNDNNIYDILSLDINFSTSFLSWIYPNSVIPENSILYKLKLFIDGIRMTTLGSTSSINKNDFISKFTQILDFTDTLSDFENFINDMGISCKLKIKNEDGSPKLFFDYNGKYLDFFENISTGTKAIVNVYVNAFVYNKKPSFLYLDEFDAFYHYELSQRVIKCFKKYLKDTQIIFTTHNTNLMSNEIMRPDCLYILSTSGELTPLNRATKRELREGHNLEKMYISGEFSKYE